MLYKVIGLMSGSSLDGLDIVYAHFQETASSWTYEIHQSECYPYNREWTEKLKHAKDLSAIQYQVLHVEYGHYIGQQINRFIEEHHLAFQVQLIASHGHTSFHLPEQKMTAQLGDGASIAAETGIHVINELRAMDLALGGQGAPIVPIGEKLLLGDYDFFLNLGGIANISAHLSDHPGKSDNKGRFIAFDICPANRVMNMMAQEKGKEFDEDGILASSGEVNQELLNLLDQFPFYSAPYPKSLANDFGTDEVYPLVNQFSDTLENKLRTYVEHICNQIILAIKKIKEDAPFLPASMKLLATGGGAHNKFLMKRLKDVLFANHVELIAADKTLIDDKEGLIMAFIGVLRWREEINVLSSVTGASRDSVGGAVWMGR